MAVQAQYLDAHAFRHEPRAIRPELEDGAKVASSVFLADPATGGGHLLAQLLQARSELTYNNNDNDNRSGCFVPRKRAKVGDAGACSLIMEGHGGSPIPTVPMPQAFAAAGDVQSRAQGSGATSTSGRQATVAPVLSLGLLSQLHCHSVEIDALVRLEYERLRVGLEEARRRHLRAVVSALERAAARRLRQAEADLESALARSAVLEGKLQQMVAEGQAWQGIANSHEAAAAGLRATLDQLLQPPCAGAEGEAEAEDAQSCCFEQDRAADRDRTRACKACGEAEACVLLLPCRHL